MADGHGELAGFKQHTVLAGKPHGAGPGLVDEIHHALVHRTHQHHFHHIHGGLVGDAVPLTEFRLDFQLAQHFVDLRAAAVHHHGVYAHELEQADVAGEGELEAFLGHGVAAVLHYHGFPMIFAQIGQALDKHPRLQAGLFHRVG